MKWTKQQSDAIEARGCSVIVSAAEKQQSSPRG